MSNNAFSFADELRVNSSLRRKFSKTAALYLDFDEQQIEDHIEMYGGEDFVQSMMSVERKIMEKEFGVR